MNATTPDIMLADASERVEPAAPPAIHAKRSAISAVVSRVFARVLGLVFVVYLARNQSARVFAGYSYLLVLATTMAALADVGVAVLAGREVARGEASVATAYRAAAPIVLAVGTVAGVAVALVGSVAPGPMSAGAGLASVSVFIALNLFFGFQAELLRASARPVVEASLQVLGSITQIVLGIAVISSGGGLALLLAAVTIKELLLVLAAQLWLPAPWKGGRRRNWRWKLLKAGFWLSFATTALAVIGRLPQVVLGNTGSVAAVADYAVASRVVDIGMLLVTALSFGLFPWIAQQAHKDPAFLRRQLARLGVVIGAALMLCVAMLPLVSPAVRAVFGDRYRDAVPAAQVLVFSLPAMIAVFGPWNGLIAVERERRVALGTVIGLSAVCGGVAVMSTNPTPTAAAIATLAAIIATGASLTAFLAWTSRREGSGGRGASA